MNTLLLDISLWDLVTDIGGNIAVATDPYALAQDASSACRLFQAELWYDTTHGIPYWAQILGETPSIALLKAQYVNAALSVPGIESAQCFISSTAGREVSGQVQVSDETGQLLVAAF